MEALGESRWLGAPYGQCSDGHLVFALCGGGTFSPSTCDIADDVAARQGCEDCCRGRGVFLPQRIMESVMACS